MTYQESLDFLFQQFPAYQKLGKKAYKADLSNITALCNELGVEMLDQKFIHIGGTNGKGSTAHITSAILQSHGLKVGIYSSPHIKDFGERIKINGAYIEEQFVIDFTKRILPLCNTIAPSFFEITFAMALEYFKQEATDINIIEVGLGGRLDATNIISSEIAAITNVSLDHVAILGDSVEAIAKEKSGIIKTKIPLVLGEMNPVAYDILERVALKQQAEIIKLPKTFNYKLDLIGSHQLDNAKLAFTIANYALPNMDLAKVSEALSNATKISNFRGRMEVYSNKPLVILDGAHNEDGVKALINSIDKLGKKRVFAIYGTSSDKELETIFSLLPKNWIYNLTTFKNERSASVGDLKQIAIKFDLKFISFSVPKEALNYVTSRMSDDDVVIVFGSFFLLEEFY